MHANCASDKGKDASMFLVKDYSIDRIAQEEHSFFVPKYQRLSSWEKEQYTQFAEDILDDEEIESEDIYFIGTFILKPLHPQERDKVYEIIDGQQRLIAVSLLLAALYHVLHGLIEKYKNVGRPDFLVNLGICSKNLKKFLVSKNNNSREKVRFKASEYEKDDENFRKILVECGVVEATTESKLKFNSSRMTKSFNYYKKFLEDKIKNKSPDKQINMIEKILRRIEKISFIIIEVASHMNACQLFASFNDRGKPLSAMDIIKNMLFDKGGRHQEDDFFKRWSKLSQNLRENSDKSFGPPKNSDRYLRHFYNAFFRVEDKLSVSNSPVSKKKLTAIYEKIIKDKDKWSAQILVAKMEHKSQIYNAIIDPAEYKFEKKNANFAQAFEIKDNDIKKAVVEGLSDLNEVKGAPANVLLLYLFSKFLENKKFFAKQEEKTIEEIIDFLVKFFVRRNVSQFPRTNIMDPLMDKAIKDYCETNLNRLQKSISSLGLEKFITNESNPYNKKKFNEDLIDFITDESFSRKLIKIIFNRVSKFHEISSGKIKIKYSIIPNDFELEHILPQNYKEEGWIEEFNCHKNLKNEDAERDCDYWLHRIGNLTVTGGNATLSNGNFRFKQTVPIHGYQNTNFWLDNFIFEIEENGSKEMYSLATAPKWSKVFAEGRNEQLAGYIANFYQFKSEEKN